MVGGGVRAVVVGIDHPVAYAEFVHDVVVVMTYPAIVRAIWGDTDCGSTKKLQVNMANIRKKLGSVPGRNTYILNELGVGYRMIDEDTDARPES